MAGKWQAIVKIPEKPQEEGYLPWAASHAASGITGTLGGLWGALSQPFDEEQEAAAQAKYYGNPKAGPVDVDYGPNPIPNPFEMAQQAFPRALGRQPETTGEQILQRGPQEVLMALATGGESALAKLGTAGVAALGAAAGPLAAKGLKELGAPGWAQTLGDVTAGAATNVLGNVVAKKIPIRPSTIKKAAQAELPKASEKAGLLSAETLKDSMREIAAEYKKMADGPAKRTLKQIYETINQRVSKKGIVDLNDLKGARERIDALWPDVVNHKLEKFALPVRTELNEILRSDVAKIINPKYFKNLSISDVGTIIDNSQSVLSRIAKQIEPGKWDIALGAVLGKWPVIAKGAVWGILKGSGAVHDTLRYLIKSPGFRKEYMKLVTATSPAQYMSQATKVVDFLSKNPKLVEGMPKKGSGKWQAIVKIDK